MKTHSLFPIFVSLFWDVVWVLLQDDEVLKDHVLDGHVLVIAKLGSLSGGNEHGARMGLEASNPLGLTSLTDCINSLADPDLHLDVFQVFVNLN